MKHMIFLVAAAAFALAGCGEARGADFEEQLRVPAAQHVMLQLARTAITEYLLHGRVIGLPGNAGALLRRRPR